MTPTHSTPQPIPAAARGPPLLTASMAFGRLTEMK